MKIKKFVLVRNIENKEDYEIKEFEVGLLQALTTDCLDTFDFFFSILFIWFTLCLILGSVLGFIYLIKTYFL